MPEGPGFWFLSYVPQAANPTDTPLSNQTLFDDGRTYSPILRGQRFPLLGWDPILKAMAIATEFAATGNKWKEIDVPAPREEDLDKDIPTLIGYRDSEREKRREEIAAQATTFRDYFAHLLSAMPPARPHTYVLMTTGIYVASIVAAYWKLKHMRPRPVQVCASVFPTIETPPHPSYPSGHALQALLVAACVKLVAPHQRHEEIDSLAKRVGENREYAGVHYPSDTRASQDLAPKIFEILRNPDLVPTFDELVGLAKKEWEGEQR